MLLYYLPGLCIAIPFRLALAFYFLSCPDVNVNKDVEVDRLYGRLTEAYLFDNYLIMIISPGNPIFLRMPVSQVCKYLLFCKDA